MLTDFDAGTIGTRYLFEDQDRRENTCEADLDFSFYLTEQDSMVHRGGSVAITLTPQASHTLAVLEELGVLTNTRIARTHAQADRWYAITDGAEDTSSLYTTSLMDHTVKHAPPAPIGAGGACFFWLGLHGLFHDIPHDLPVMALST